MQIFVGKGTDAGLTKGTTGECKDIIYTDGVSPPALPEMVWVDFGDAYTGPKFFPNRTNRDGWVPVRPFTAIEIVRDSRTSRFKELSRTMIPLRLAYAWTKWKSQGQSMTGKVVVVLGNKEREHGLTYVAFSRVTNFKNLGIEGGMTLERFTKKIKDHGKMAPRIAEEARLRELATLTESRLAAEASNE